MGKRTGYRSNRGYPSDQLSPLKPSTSTTSLSSLQRDSESEWHIISGRRSLLDKLAELAARALFSLDNLALTECCFLVSSASVIAVEVFEEMDDEAEDVGLAATSSIGSGGSSV